MTCLFFWCPVCFLNDTFVSPVTWLFHWWRGCLPVDVCVSLRTYVFLLTCFFVFFSPLPPLGRVCLTDYVCCLRDRVCLPDDMFVSLMTCLSPWWRVCLTDYVCCRPDDVFVSLAGRVCLPNVFVSLTGRVCLPDNVFVSPRTCMFVSLMTCLSHWWRVLSPWQDVCGASRSLLCLGWNSMCQRWTGVSGITVHFCQ